MLHLVLCQWFIKDCGKSFQNNRKTGSHKVKFDKHVSACDGNILQSMIKEFYDVPDNDKDAWYTLLLDAQNYKIYNFSQICRHLMAIWRKHKEDKQLKIVFQSVIWKMTDKFIENIDNEEDKEILRSRIIVIDKEAKSAKSRIDKFLADIDWKNITFESVYYNDILEDISFSKYCSEFKQRYFL